MQFFACSTALEYIVEEGLFLVLELTLKRKRPFKNVSYSFHFNPVSELFFAGWSEMFHPVAR